MGDDTEYLKLSIEDRCVHKSWKARLNGYEEAAKLFSKLDEKSPEFSKYLGLLKKFVTDNNAVAQEKGLDAVLLYLENAAVAPKTVGEVSTGVITKCLNSPRTKTKEKGMEILLMYIELEKGETVQEELLKGLDHKQPKIVAACLTVLREALHGFGSKILPVKPIVKTLPKQFENRDKNVREEAKLLTIEIYRWVGSAFKAAIQNVSAVILKELDEEFEKLPGKAAKQTRFLKSQQDLKAKMEEQADAEDDEDDDEEAGAVAADIDPYDLLDPVEILSKIPKDFYENIEAKKWQIRKEALEAIQPLTSNPKLEPGDYGDLCRALKKVVGKDTNVMLVAQAGKCLCGLATGLRKKFQPYAGQCIQTILEKFKEKKLSVVTALREAIDAMFPSTTLQAIQEDVLTALDSKNPAIKAETSSFLARCFKKSKPANLPKSVLKPLCSSLAKKMDDTAPDVRNAAAEALGTVLKVMGEKPLSAFLADMDKLKVDKIKEASEKVELELGGKKSKPAEDKKTKAAEPSKAPSKGPAKGPAKSVRPGARPATAGPKGRAGGDGAKRPSTAPSGGRKKGKGSDGNEDLTSDPLLTDEEVAEKAEILLPLSVRQPLESSNWKERLAAVEEYTKFVENIEKKDMQVQVMVRVLARKPGWKENNFQVLKGKFNLMKMIAEKGRVSRRAASFVISGAVDKIGDVKNGSAAGEVLTALAEATNLGWLATEAVGYAFDDQKNPKNQSETLNWLSNAIKEFGFSSISPKFYIPYMKKALGAVNPAVRVSAVTLLGVMYMYMGAPLRTLFDDEKPALLKQIDTEIEKVQGESPPKPIRGAAKNSGGGDSDGDDDEDDEVDEGAGGAAAMEDLIPRVDIGPKITSQIIEEMADAKWKIRGEALQKVQDILNEAKFITPNLGDLPPALKARLADKNKLLATQTVNICQQIATSMGTNVNKYTKIFAPGMLSLCSDNKASVRNAAVTCLKTWVELTGIIPFFEDEIMMSALSTENPYMKIEIYGWLEEVLPKYRSIPNEGVIQCIPSLYSALEDRNADVRKKAQAAVPMFMMHLGYEKMIRMTSKLKPSSKDQVAGILEKQRANVPAKPGKAKKATGEGEEKRKEPETAVSKEPEPKRPKTAASKMRAAKSMPSIPGEVNVEKNKAERNNALIDGPVKGSLLTKKGKAVLSKGKSSKKGAAEEDTGPALIANNGKTKRMKDESELKTLKWNFQAPRDEHIDQLKDQMQGTFSKAVVTSLFHADFKQHINAINTFIDCVENNKEAVISNTDLLLRYMTLRFFDTNTTVILKCLEFLSALFTMLAAQEYHLTEYEAYSYLPYFIIKVGDSKEPVRRGVRNIMKLITKVYPASKMFSYLMNGLVSKNSRQRQECLEELGCLIELYGMNVCQPTQSKALKEIAIQIGDRDSGVRSSALNTLVQAYAIVGNDLYKLVGNLNEKDMSYLEERIKRSAKKPPAKAEKEKKEEKTAKPDQKKGAMPPGWRDQFRNPSAGPKPAQKESKIPREFSLDLDKLGLEQTVSEDMPELVDNEVDDLLNQPVKLPEPKLRPASPSLSRLATSSSASSALDLAISQVASNDITISVQALAQIDEVLKDEEKSKSLYNHVDQLLVVTAIQLRMAYTKYIGDDDRSRENVIKLYRCLIACLMSLFQNSTLSKRVSREVLKDLIHGLITVLLDDRMATEFEDGPQVVRSVNVLVVKVVEKSDHNNIMGALIKLLQDCIAVETVSLKFRELVMKCLWKMVRMLPNIATDMNVDKMLLDLHVFLKTFPSQTWKERGNDTPLRTIKTIIHSLAKILGNKILSHFSLIEDPNESELQAYLQKVLRTGTGRRSSTPKPTSNVSQVNGNPVNDSTDKTTAPRVEETQSPRRSGKSIVLAQIFKKISSKENSREGLQELYDFKKKYPDTDVEPYLKQTSEFFRSYIERGLKCIERERDGKTATAEVVSETAEGGDPGSGIAITSSQSSDDLSPSAYRDRLKVLRARSGLDNIGDGKSIGSGLVRPDSAPASLESKPPAPHQYSFQKISLGTSSTSIPNTAPSQKTDTNVAELKKRLERIKKQSQT